MSTALDGHAVTIKRSGRDAYWVECACGAAMRGIPIERIGPYVYEHLRETIEEWERQG